MRRLLLIAALTFATPAFAQDEGDQPASASIGRLDVRLSQMDEQLRQIRGQIEQLQFQQRQADAVQKKANDDVEYRLRALEQKQTEAAALAAAAPVAPTAPAAEETTTPATYLPEKPAASAPEKPALTGNDFPSANAHYAAAFDLLNRKKYAEAGASFDAFVHKYPSDPLTANAFYWLGESYYARADNTRAAESFRKGFEASPDGQKAPDNLFKLALSLHNIKRTSEACIVLQQVANKYGTSNPRTAQRAIDQRVQMQCK